MDVVISLANANREVNLCRRERLKPELHPSYHQLCNPSHTITSQLFREGPSKDVKDIAEANKISFYDTRWEEISRQKGRKAKVKAVCMLPQPH